MRWMRERVRKELENAQRRVPRWLKRLGASDYRVWKSALPDEVRFFDRRLAQFDRHFAGQNDPREPLQEEYRLLLGARPGEEVSILDVGSGPLTSVGKFWEGRTISITAVDALGDEYNRLLRKHGIQPLVPIGQCDAESLSERFPEGSFDLVVAHNSIDHCYDAPQAIRSMVSVVRPGGHVYLFHKLNEAKNRKNTGMHQWNFSEANGRFVADNGKVRCDLTESLAAFAQVETTTGDGRIKVIIRKAAAPSPCGQPR